MTDTNQSQLPAWVWLFTGVVTGLFLAFLYYLTGVQVPNEATVDSTAQAENTHTKAPKFDFYTVLPDVERMAKNALKDQPKDNNASKEAGFGSLIIQTGSFQSLQDADRRRAELLLLGLDVKTEKVELAGQIFHRVQVGPFSDPRSLQAAKNTLNDNNIEHIVLTLK